MKLSTTMEVVLILMFKHGGHASDSPRCTTMNALGRRGLVRFYPYSKVFGAMGDGAWKLTAQGRQTAKELSKQHIAVVNHDNPSIKLECPQP